MKFQVTNKECFSLDFSYFNEHILVSGCSNGGIKLFDIRNTVEELLLF